MKVYLDDIRIPTKDWTLVKWPNEAIKLLKTGKVTEISLDHDLGNDRKGMGNDVILWMEEKVITSSFIPPKIHIHTANSSARSKMEKGVKSILKHYHGSLRKV